MTYEYLADIAQVIFHIFGIMRLLKGEQTLVFLQEGLSKYYFQLNIISAQAK